MMLSMMVPTDYKIYEERYTKNTMYILLLTINHKYKYSYSISCKFFTYTISMFISDNLKQNLYKKYVWLQLQIFYLKCKKWNKRTWISICLGLFINFSISKRSSPKLDFASCDDKRNPSLHIFQDVSWVEMTWFYLIKALLKLFIPRMSAI